MKLIIHAGTHKTATTSFQFLCGKNNNFLEGKSLYYPIIENKIEDLGAIIFNKFNCSNQTNVRNIDNHSYLAWMIQSKQLDHVTSLFKRFFIEAKRLECKYVLLSGEDFENVLIDYSMHECTEEIAKGCGFKNIEWVFVKRKSYDYLLSLYSELAVNGFCYNLYDMYDKIIHDGYFKASNRFYDWIFIFDLKEKFELFNHNVTSFSRLIYFEDFLKGFPGKELLEKYLDTETILKLQEESLSISPMRISRSKENIELLYICSFLNIKASQKNYDSNKNIIDSLVSFRLISIESKKINMKKTLTSKFDL